MPVATCMASLPALCHSLPYSASLHLHISLDRIPSEDLHQLITQAPIPDLLRCHPP